MTTSAPSRRRGSSPLSLRLLLICGFLFAAAAVVMVFLFPSDERWLRLGVLLAVWAALMTAFAVSRARREAQAVIQREAEITRTYELELHREVTARREFEVSLGEQVREDVESQHTAEIKGLREQLDRLTETLSSLLEGDLLVERLTLSAESTRVRGLSDSARARLPGVQRAALDAGNGQDDETIDAELVDESVSGAARPTGTEAVPVVGPTGGNASGIGFTRVESPDAGWASRHRQDVQQAAATVAADADSRRRTLERTHEQERAQARQRAEQQKIEDAAAAERAQQQRAREAADRAAQQTARRLEREREEAVARADAEKAAREAAEASARNAAALAQAERQAREAAEDSARTEALKRAEQLRRIESQREAEAARAALIARAEEKSRVAAAARQAESDRIERDRRDAADAADAADRVRAEQERVRLEQADTRRRETERRERRRAVADTSPTERTAEQVRVGSNGEVLQGAASVLAPGPEPVLRLPGSADAPDADAPVADAPVADAPNADAPVEDALAGDVPGTGKFVGPMDDGDASGHPHDGEPGGHEDDGTKTSVADLIAALGGGLGEPRRRRRAAD